jgi:GTPase SAR1 family protein
MIGQEQFRSVTMMCFHESAGALLVRDITNPASLESLVQWARAERLFPRRWQQVRPREREVDRQRQRQ